MRPKAMVVAGVMSGTSADGVDVALVRISTGPKIEVIGHSEFPYAEALREAVLQAASGEMKVAELSRLHWKLGEVYAECVEKACIAAGVDIDAAKPTSQKRDLKHPVLALVGMHGQTVFHEAPRATWQMGEAAVVRERLGVPVVSDFRPADMAAGGQGAPLVPMLDYCLFRSTTKNRVLLNLGGIANMTLLPAGKGLEDVIAFDSGPANMVVDALMNKFYGRGFDCGGGTAGRGTVIPAVAEQILRDDYFAKAAPKSCGREQFGAEFVDRLQALCVAAGATQKADVVATATEITVQSVFEAYERIGRPLLGTEPTELIAAGGGTRNEVVMKRLRELFGEAGVSVMTTEDVGLASQAKEAVAFALLAWLSWHGMPGSVPRATGAGGARVLGKISW